MAAPLDLSTASEIAQAFYPALTAIWPHFAAYAGIEGGDLIFEIPSPNPNVPLGELALWICADADSDETIIAFGGGHSHGGDWRAPEDPDFRFESAIKLIRDIVEERYCGWTSETGGAIADLGWIEGQSHGRVRSWLGTHDR